jgi:hypothetical protein|tara:strand:- start:1260 stop:1535 length:276 start_codon:yes stop_codon:yes gene_type:complete
MNKDLEKWLIIGLVLVLVMISLQGCANKTKVIKSEPSVNVFNGTISKMLGCIFAPAECKDLQNSKESNEELQDQITEEMMEMDSADDKTAN